MRLSSSTTAITYISTSRRCTALPASGGRARQQAPTSRFLLLDSSSSPSRDPARSATSSRAREKAPQQLDVALDERRVDPGRRWSTSVVKVERFNPRLEDDLLPRRDAGISCNEPRSSHLASRRTRFLLIVSASSGRASRAAGLFSARFDEVANFGPLRRAASRSRRTRSCCVEQASALSWAQACRS